MKTTALWLALALIACGRESPPDPHSPQASQLIALRGAARPDCSALVAPTSESWSDTAGWCEWSCVYAGSTLFASLRQTFTRVDASSAWGLAMNEWTPGSASDCAGAAR